MKRTVAALRSRFVVAAALCAVLLGTARIRAQDGVLPSWNDGPAKRAILDFVRATTDKASPKYVPPEDRIATFDNDGTLWGEQPLYTQVVFAMERVAALAPEHPEWNDQEPFQTILTRDHEAIAKLTIHDLEKIIDVTHSGMAVEAFGAIVKSWLAQAKHPRYHRLYTELVYQPMLELMQYLRANGYKTYIVTGGGQEFVRAFAERVYGVPPEQVIGSAGKAKFEYGKDGQPMLVKLPEVLRIDDKAGKPEGINLVIGRRPRAAVGNSNGDRQMLEWTQAGDGARLAMLVLHDDATREYAYGPAEGLPDSKIGTFTQALYDEAKKNGWSVISMKDDWNTVFPWQKP